MKSQTNILLTGATGFVGRAVLRLLCKHESHKVTVALRSADDFDCCTAHVIGELSSSIDWTTALSNQQVVIHLAALTHIIKDGESEQLAEYRRVNVDGTLNLARQAAVAGVKRFIFISSIKVNGEQTPMGLPFSADDIPAPEDAYGISKLEAELGLQQLASKNGMEVVIIRPPLVYGPGVKGNFATIIKLVARGLPLPLGSIHNQRSLVAVDNLVDLIITCVDHPAAANQVFLAGDGHDLSSTELLRGVARAMGEPTRLFPIPQSMLMFGARLLGKSGVAQRLLGSLQVDISKARDLLNWEPPITVEEGLRRCFQSQDK